MSLVIPTFRLLAMWGGGCTERTAADHSEARVADYLSSAGVTRRASGRGLLLRAGSPCVQFAGHVGPALDSRLDALGNRRSIPFHLCGCPHPLTCTRQAPWPSCSPWNPTGEVLQPACRELRRFCVACGIKPQLQCPSARSCGRPDASRV